MKRAEVYLVNFGKKYNSEFGKVRPALIIQNDVSTGRTRFTNKYMYKNRYFHGYTRKITRNYGYICTMGYFFLIKF